MALQYNVQSELEALSAQNRNTSNRLSDQRVAMFGSSRMSDIRAPLRGKQDYDTWAGYIAASTNASTTSNYLTEKKKNFHLNDKYLIQYILSLPNLLAYYPLNEASGNALDNSSSGLNGTVSATQAQPGKAGKAYSFNGTSDNVLLKDGSNVAGLTNYSIFLMFITSRAPSGGSGDTLYSERAAAGNDILKLEISAEVTINRLRPVLRDDAATLDKPNNTTGIDVTNNVWHTAVMRQVGTTVSIFVDGVSDFSFTKTSTDAFTNASLKTYLCRDIADAAAFCQASVQHVALFSTALSDNQILKLAQIAGVA